MTKIGSAHIEIIEESSELLVLKEILATLKRIEAQGAPFAVNQTFVVKPGEFEEDTVAQAAESSLYWDMLRSNNGKAEREQLVEEEPDPVVQDFIAQVEASNGEPVALQDITKKCEGCDECCDD